MTTVGIYSNPPRLKFPDLITFEFTRVFTRNGESRYFSANLMPI